MSLEILGLLLLYLPTPKIELPLSWLRSTWLQKQMHIIFSNLKKVLLLLQLEPPNVQKLLEFFYPVSVTTLVAGR